MEKLETRLSLSSVLSSVSLTHLWHAKDNGYPMQVFRHVWLRRWWKLGLGLSLFGDWH